MPKKNSSEMDALNDMAWIAEMYHAYQDLDDGAKNAKVEGMVYTTAEEVEDATRDSFGPAEITSGWVTSVTDMVPARFRICLGDGSPEVVIFGDVGNHGEFNNPQFKFRTADMEYEVLQIAADDVNYPALEWFCHLFDLMY